MQLRWLFPFYGPSPSIIQPKKHQNRGQIPVGIVLLSYPKGHEQGSYFIFLSSPPQRACFLSLAPPSYYAVFHSFSTKDQVLWWWTPALGWSIRMQSRWLGVMCMLLNENNAMTPNWRGIRFNVLVRKK